MVRLDTDFIIIVVLLFLLFKNYNVMGTIERFVTLPPPQLPKKKEDWEDNYSAESWKREKDIMHMQALANYFPMKKAPETQLRTPEGLFDITRADFVPHMAKRNQAL